MSDEQDESRKADIRIVRAPDSSYYRVDVKFLGHISAAIRWDDRVEGARAEVKALLRDAPNFIKQAFLEVDIEKAVAEQGDLDAEWAYYQGEHPGPQPEDTMHQPVEDEDEQ